MTNADKFKNIFGLYATELWSMPEKDFLKWLNSEVMNCSEIPIKTLPPAQPEIIRCKDCIHFHYDFPYVIQGIPVFVHEICDFWGDGCKTSENEFCSHAERRSDVKTDKGASC